MATKITDMQLVPLFQFFQNNVYPLNGIDCAFLTYKIGELFPNGLIAL